MLLLPNIEKEYDFADNCKAGGKDREQVRCAAREEIALRRFLEEKGAKAFTTNFDDLAGVDQLPGLACQRLMAEGYGFGAEGDWKTAALLPHHVVHGAGVAPGLFFPRRLYAQLRREKQRHTASPHARGVSPTSPNINPSWRVHPLSVLAGRMRPARLVSTSKQGPGVAATIVDMGNRFRLIVNEVECTKSKELPKLPVASALWIPQPDFATGAAAWILAGGTHHTSFSYDLTTEYLEDYADIAGIEMVVIDKNTTIPQFKKELRLNEIYYMLNKALC